MVDNFIYVRDYDGLLILFSRSKHFYENKTCGLDKTYKIKTIKTSSYYKLTQHSLVCIKC